MQNEELPTDEQNETKLDNAPVDVLDIRIAALLVECPGYTDQQIAEQVGVSRQTVNRRRNSDGVRNILRTILAIPEREVRRITAKSLKRLEALLDHEDPRIQLAATLGMLKHCPALMSDEMQEMMFQITGPV